MFCPDRDGFAIGFDRAGLAVAKMGPAIDDADFGLAKQCRNTRVQFSDDTVLPLYCLAEVEFRGSWLMDCKMMPMAPSCFRMAW